MGTKARFRKMDGKGRNIKPYVNIETTTQGNMDGSWLIKINNIRDEQLYKIECMLLKLFGRKKQGDKTFK